MVSALRIHPFGRLLATYTLDGLADWLVSIGLAVLVYERTESALAVAALLLASRFAPSLVIAPLAGRLGTRRIGAALAALYASSATFAIILAFSSSGPLASLYLLTFAATTAAATARVLTRTAACNGLEAHGKLREGAAALNLSTGTTSVLGPAVAGVCAVAVGTQGTVLLAALVFGTLTVATWPLRAAATTEDEAAEVASVREAVAVMASGPGVAAVLIAATLLLVLFSMDEPIMLPYVEQALGGDADQFAALLSIWGLGLLVGGGLFAAVRRWSMLGTFVVAGTLFGGAYMLLGVAHSALVAYGACLIGGIGNGMFWGAFTVVTMEAVSPAIRTRASGVVESIALAAPGVGYLLGGVLGEVLAPAQVYLLAGAAGLSIVTALGLATGPARRVPVPVLRPALRGATPTSPGG